MTRRSTASILKDEVKEEEKIVPLAISEEVEHIDATLSEDIRNCFLSRELSWLQFNLRVLYQAEDKNVPLLERLKFLSIYYSNLDEFFMVRLGSLSHRNLFFPNYKDPKTGWTASMEIKKVLKEVSVQQKIAEGIWQALSSDLKLAGFEILSFKKLSKVDETMARKIFTEIRPLLEPRVVDAQHPMPFLGNCESCMAALLDKNGVSSIGLVPLYRLPKFKSYEDNGITKIIIIADLVSYYADALFKKRTVKESCSIRLTRNADVFLEGIEDSYGEDFRSKMKKLLKKRKREMPLRLQVCGRISRSFASMLCENIGISEKNCFATSVPFDLGIGSIIHGGSELKYAPRKSQRTVELTKGEYFDYLQTHDILLSFPYQSIAPFIDMLYEAADDPSVISIRICLYRLAASSKLAAALAYAADRGKDVLCLLELRARFDEQNNIDYSEVLEEAGCSVIYGLPNKKVHSKLCLITRQQGEELSYITQVGTGNYNEVTSEQYADLSFITSNKQIGLDAASVFDSLAIGEVPGKTESLWVAPDGFKSNLLAMLDKEIAKGGDGAVAIKVNSLNDVDVMKKLIECSRAGVRVELFVRGICCLKPGIPGYTENINIKSVIGRHLEHSRIFVFGTGDNRRIFIGSGDLLSRNTQRRVEVFAEILSKDIRSQVLEVMEAFRRDNTRGWVMLPDGNYAKPIGSGSDSQDRLYKFFANQKIVGNEDLKKESFFQKAFGWFARKK